MLLGEGGGHRGRSDQGTCGLNVCQVSDKRRAKVHVRAELLGGHRGESRGQGGQDTCFLSVHLEAVWVRVEIDTL